MSDNLSSNPSGMGGARHTFPCPDHPGVLVGFFEECPICHWAPWKKWFIILLIVAVAGIVLGVAVPFILPPITPTPSPSTPVGTRTPTSTRTLRTVISVTETPTPTTPTYTFTPSPSITAAVSPSNTPTKTTIPSPTPPVPVAFTVETIATGKSGGYNSIAFDRDNNPVIAYIKLNSKQGTTDFDQLMIARLTNGFWSTKAITDGSSNDGFFNSLKADSNGNLYLTYYNYSKSNIFYTYSLSGSTSWASPYILAWAPRKPENNDERSKSFIAVDSNQKAHVVFFEANSNRLLYLDGSKNWAKQEIANNIDLTGYSFPVTIDKNNQPVAAYYDKAKGLIVARLQSGIWKADNDIEKFGFGLFPSITVDTQGNLYLSYFDSRSSRLKFTFHNGMSWSDPVTIDENGGKYSSIAVSNDGLIHIAYTGDFNTSTCNLKYVIGAGQSFSKPVILFSSLPVASEKHLSLALDKAGKPWVSFYDQNPNVLALKIARQK